MGAIVPLIGIAPKTRLLPLVIFFCPCRKSTFIHPVLSPPRNRITPVNITVPPLSIFAATALPSKPSLRMLWSHPPAMELTVICFVEDAAYLIVSYDLFIHTISPKLPRLWYSTYLALKTTFGHFCSFPSGQEIFSLGGTSNQKRQTTDKLKRTFWTRWWGQRSVVF